MANHSSQQQRMNELLGHRWMAQLNSRLQEKLNFTEGIVNPARKHVKLFYRFSDNPVALVAYDKRLGFSVQLFTDQFVGEIRPKMANATRLELQRCLRPDGKNNPWALVQISASSSGPHAAFRWNWPPEGSA